MQPQNPPQESSDPNPAEVVAFLDELESALKVKPPDRAFQPFWSENWTPPELRPPEAEPEYRGGPWGSPIDLIEEFGTSADDNWAYAKPRRATAETSMSDSSGTRERHDQSPDAPDRGGQDVPPDRR
jgi:hypothetical protein